jgi:hypothetical protein
MTPFQERMEASKKRKATILRLYRKTGPRGKMTQAEIATEVKCSKAYVNQIIAAAKEKQP